VIQEKYVGPVLTYYVAIRLDLWSCQFSGLNLIFWAENWHTVTPALGNKQSQQQFCFIDAFFFSS